MVMIPASWFYYGSSTAFELGISTHLPTYSIDEYEVTAGDYKSCVDAGECTYSGGTESDATYLHVDRADHPVNDVSWQYSVGARGILRAVLAPPSG